MLERVACMFDDVCWTNVLISIKHFLQNTTNVEACSLPFNNAVLQDFAQNLVKLVTTHSHNFTKSVGILRWKFQISGPTEQFLKCGGRSRLFNWGKRADSKNG